ncbi:MAG: hypothetical protein V4553_15100 [Bacteroidota bacterium]
MKNSNQNWDNKNQPRKTEKSQQVNQPQSKNTTTDKKSVYIKDMPPIDGARPGVI